MKKRLFYSTLIAKSSRSKVTKILQTISVVTLAITMNLSFGRNSELINIHNEPALPLLMPDSTDDSTTTMEYEFGDTVEVYVDGVDTVYFLYEDTSDSTSERVMNNTDIVITLGDEQLPVQSGIFGMNITDYFMPSHANPADNDEYTIIPNPYELMTAYAPKTIRYPGGASRKFSHAFGSMNSSDPNNPYSDLKNGGYGMNIEELIPYYNMSDDIPDVITLNDLITDMGDGDIDGTWLDGTTSGGLEDYYNVTIR